MLMMLDQNLSSKFVSIFNALFSGVFLGSIKDPQRQESLKIRCIKTSVPPHRNTHELLSTGQAGVQLTWTCWHRWHVCPHADSAA